MLPSRHPWRERGDPCGERAYYTDQNYRRGASMHEPTIKAINAEE